MLISICTRLNHNILRKANTKNRIEKWDVFAPNFLPDWRLESPQTVIEMVQRHLRFSSRQTFNNKTDIGTL